MQVHGQWAVVSNCDRHTSSSHDKLIKVKYEHGKAPTLLLLLDLDYSTAIVE